MATKTLEEYEKRICISYLDEVDAFVLSNVFLKTMVSLTSLKNIYINSFEKDWKKLRQDYGIPSGKCLHFSQIKFLLNSDDTKHNPEFKVIFSNSSGAIDNGKLYNFYRDILSIIDNNYIVFQATGIASKRQYASLIPKIKMNSVMYQLFNEHLDRMAFYLVRLAVDEYNTKINALRAAGQTDKVNKLSLHYYFTKLRYDGSYVLNERNDYRDAFSHCISDGTKHFNSETIKEVFDNLSFVSKKEVGLCTNCNSTCNHEAISHAGAELVDFVAVYIARNMWMRYYKDYKINIDGEDPLAIDAKLELDCNIKIPGYSLLDPMPHIEPKLFENQDVAKYKAIIDFPI